ncbi:MAG: ABC transporter ATP-binding protein [Pseudomonadota bacterium]
MDKTLPLLHLENITRRYGEVEVLNGASLTLQAGEAVAIVGPSGSGKSTLLQVAGLLDPPDSGTVTVQGKNLALLRDDARAALRNAACGFVYQFHHLLREFTALENVLMPAVIAGKVTPTQRKRAEGLLKTVGLTHRMQHLPSQLSGGEQQRVAIARALMNKPKLLLADEPTGNLDPQTAAEVTDALFTLIDQEGMAALIVTHNPTLAARCHHSYTMQGGVLAATKGRRNK